MWCGQHPAWSLTLVTVLVFLPFIGKPFSIDDPLFIWAAKHIQSRPLNPYGFNVNWYGFNDPFWLVTKNPPLECYYLAAAGIVGWSETIMHAALLLPAIASVLGTYRLATHFCKHAGLAALLALFTPVFVVSGTTIMCDVLMLAFWVWALVFWIEGTKYRRPGYFAAAAVFVTCETLTKYFGACLIPLVAAWSIAGKRPVKEWLGWLLIPVAVLIGYQFATYSLYGHGLLSDASSYAVSTHHQSILLNVRLFLTALAFTGGCLAVAVFFAPLLWSWRELLLGAAASLAGAVILFVLARSTFEQPLATGQILQILFWAAGGISVIALAITDICRRRDADALLLLCWMIGTFVFTAFLNWVINGRSALPMAIPLGILVARRLETRIDEGVKFSRIALVVPCVLAGSLAIWIGIADYSFATASRKAAKEVCSVFSKAGGRLWFEGHWGFQYYMEENGASALDFGGARLTPGDHVVVPSDNTNVRPLGNSFTKLGAYTLIIPSWVSTMNKSMGAGFYASVAGPLPFAFGKTTPHVSTVFVYDPNGEMQKADSSK